MSDAELVRRVERDHARPRGADPRPTRPRSRPGVAQVSRSFLLIFFLYGLVVPLVIGLFFLILTVQKTRTLTLLRAIGARQRSLVRALMLQVVVVVGLGVGIGAALYAPVSQQRIGSIPLRFDPIAVVGWGVLILVLGAVSALFAARRIARIEPAEASRWRCGMRLGIREMRRQPGRFVAAVVLLAFIATLLMLLGGLLDGLIRQATGAIEAQRADLVVFSDDGRAFAAAQPDHTRGA